MALRYRGREQAGTPRSPLRALGSRKSGHLQWIQGHEFHSKRPHRPEARKDSDSRSRKARGARPHPSCFADDENRAPHRPARAPTLQGLWQVGHKRRRERQVRPLHRRPRGGQRHAPCRRTRPLPEARAFPCRLTSSRHRHHQTRRAGSLPLLRQTLQNGPRTRLPRCRRRTRRGLRRIPHNLRQLDELLARGICARHRLHGEGSLRFRIRPPPYARQRKRTGDRRPALSAHRGNLRSHREGQPPRDAYYHERRRDSSARRYP